MAYVKFDRQTSMADAKDATKFDLDTIYLVKETPTSTSGSIIMGGIEYGSSLQQSSGIDTVVTKTNINTMAEVYAKYPSGFPVGYTLKQFLTDIYNKTFQKKTPRSAEAPTIELTITGAQTAEVYSSDVNFVVSEKANSFIDGTVYTYADSNHGVQDVSETSSAAGATETVNSLKIYVGDVEKILTNQTFTEKLTPSSIPGTLNTASYTGTVDYTVTSPKQSCDSYHESCSTPITDGTTPKSDAVSSSLISTYYVWFGGASQLGLSAKSLSSASSTDANPLVIYYPDGYSMNITYKELGTTYTPTGSTTTAYAALPTGGDVTKLTTTDPGGNSKKYNKWTETGSRAARTYSITFTKNS